LRDEIGFASPQELTEQISRDIEDARAVAGELK
jgi:FAD synthase